MIVVEFHTLDEFISELREQFHHVADKIVRWQKNTTPEQKEGVSHQIDVWATALKKGGGDEDWLMEFGAVAGRDTRSDNAGSKVADEWLGRLTSACAEMRLKLRSGKIEVY